MSGQALVEFDVYDNIGWYDIDVDFLKIVEKPVVKEEPKAKAGGGTAQVGPSKMSAADVLAAARGQGAGSAPPAVETTDDDIEMVEEEVVAEEPVAEPAAEEPVTEEPAATAPTTDDGPLPTAIEDILAFCRQRDGS